MPRKVPNHAGYFLHTFHTNCVVIYPSSIEVLTGNCGTTACWAAVLSLMMNLPENNDKLLVLSLNIAMLFSRTVKFSSVIWYLPHVIKIVYGMLFSFIAATQSCGDTSGKSAISIRFTKRYFLDIWDGTLLLCARLSFKMHSVMIVVCCMSMLDLAYKIKPSLALNGRSSTRSEPYSNYIITHETFRFSTHFSNAFWK